MFLRNISIVVAAMLCMACGPFHKSPAVDFTQEFPLESKYENSLQAKWDSKEVLDSKLVEDMEGGTVISLLGNAAVDYTDENSYDGRQSLRYHTSLVDHDVLKAERNAFGGFGGQQGGEAGFAIDFAEPQDWSEYNRLSMWVYIHPSKNPNVHLFITFNNEGSPDNTLSPSRQTNISDIPQGVWHNVVWEIDYTDRDRISQLVVSQHNIGYDRDMGEQFVKIDFDRIEIQKVEPDHYSGWDVAPGQISFSHIGYRPSDAKVALASYSDIPEFTLSDDKGRTVFTGKVEKVSNKGRDFASLDFTSFDRPGTYVLKYGKAESRPFPIGEYVWLDPMFGALNFYYCQRCGYEVPGIHGVCHQDCFGFHGDEQKIVNGGWHDAGDLSQGFFRTSMSAYALMRNLQVIKSDPKLAELAERIDQEAGWGVSWLMNVCFPEGYHVTWNTQRIYTDNVEGTLDDSRVRAVFSRWENFLGVAVFLTAADCLDSMADRKEELLALAVDKWEHTYASRIWNSAGHVEAAWGAISSAKLYHRFGDEKYKKAALEFGRLLKSCQELRFVDGIPVAGYFYGGTGSRWLVHDNHVSFNEAPMIAFRELCRVFPDEPEWMEWYAGAAVYSEYFIKKGSEIAAPFDLVPNGVFRRSDYGVHNADRPNYGLIQYEDGTQLNENYAIRTFPIWGDHVFHGGTACHMSNSWAYAEAVSLVNDTEGMDVVKSQLEWVLGRNPFCQSLMYGVGYDFSPLFTFCTHNIVGALPVGVDSFKDDEPYWIPTANATCKEIWVSPVSRFLGTLANYLADAGDGSPVEVEMNVEGNVITADFKGEGKHKVELRLFNATSDITNVDLDLTSSQNVSSVFNLSVIDAEMPYVVALIVDGDVENATMLTGTAK